ncbi:MAG: TPM domain-containing protein [Lachnospiraceae bacterium]|nr:TPM domain-containing protein [Lachnospiraceae bacterium]
MKEYFRYFRFLFIAFAAVFVIWIFCVGGKMLSGGNQGIERTNTECTTEERVFDYGNVLTDEEENKLREQIAEREKQAGIDIVLVTLNESLKEYARGYDSNVSYDKFVMIYADNFYDEHKFGYNKPIGDGVLLLDNIYREDDGKVYTWMCTTGKAEIVYSSAMIDHALDVFYEYVDTDPYRAYKNFVDQVYADMRMDGNAVVMPWYMPIALAFIATIVFIIVNLANRKGRRTTNQRSYVNGGQPRIRRKEDAFIRKSVTSRTIETSSGGSGGGGGGGHHTSSSGASHGGGGHSR